jgi:hypothetical protein
VRESPRRFLVLAGHEDPDVEDTVDRYDGVLVVKKRIEASGVALEHDPRSED